MSKRTIEDVADNPRPGDKVVNRHAAACQTRLVVDRTLGGDVCYLYHERAKWRATSSLAQWRDFCYGAKLVRTAP